MLHSAKRSFAFRKIEYNGRQLTARFNGGRVAAIRMGRSKT